VDRRLVVLSYGLGVDSTAILLRWLTDPSSRDFPLHNLIVITAMTGNEWSVTGEMVTELVLPLLRKNHIRFIQVARAGRSRDDGVVILSDTTQPDRLHLEGAYTLAEEMFAAGTVPQSGGPRRCSARAKGWPLDQVIAALVGGRPYRHVLGFERTEGRRAAKDAAFNRPGVRTGEYPLIEWGWDRADCQSFIRSVLGVEFPKSACSFCPFALATESGRLRTLARFREDPASGVEALLMEHVALAINPRQGLIAGKRLHDLLASRPGNERVLELLEDQLDLLPWGLYRVQRVLRPSAKNPDKIGNGVRRLALLARGNRAEIEQKLATVARLAGTAVDASDARHPRAWVHRRGLLLPTSEYFYAISPSLPASKTGRGFGTAWADVQARARITQTDVLESAPPMLS
jgi:hypothetical protein